MVTWSAKPLAVEFDAVGGSMYIADVGQDNWEEINVQKRGKGGQNYGWRCYEGKQAYNTDSCTAFNKYTAPTCLSSYRFNNKGLLCYWWVLYRGANIRIFMAHLFNDYCNGVFRALYTVNGKVVVTNLFDADDNAL